MIDDLQTGPIDDLQTVPIGDRISSGLEPRPDRSDRLNAALAEFLEAQDAGRLLSPDQWLARHPDLEAIVYGGWRMTYREFGSCINRAAHMLLALGLGKGSPAAIISRNCPEFLILEFALYKIGAVPVKINWRLSPRSSHLPLR